MSLKKILAEANSRNATGFLDALYEELEARVAAKLGISEAEFTDNELDFEILHDYDHDLNVDASDNDVDIETDDLDDFEDLDDEELDGFLADVDFEGLEEEVAFELSITEETEEVVEETLEEDAPLAPLSKAEKLRNKLAKAIED